MAEDEEAQKKKIEDIVNATVDKRITEIQFAKDPSDDLKKFMYDKNYEELKLSREWAIKISAFTSAVYLGVITLVNSESGREIVTGEYRFVILIPLVIFALLGIINICLRHLSYLEYRNIQIGLQNDLNIHSWKNKGERIFPEPWENKIIFERKVFRWKIRLLGLFKNPSGYLFYVLYLVTISIVTAIVICHTPKKPAGDLQSLKDIKTQDSTIRSSLINILQSKEKLSVDVDTVIIKSVPAPKSPVKKKQPVGNKRN